jgi:hypothetical protein
MKWMIVEFDYPLEWIDLEMAYPLKGIKDANCMNSLVSDYKKQPLPIILE